MLSQSVNSVLRNPSLRGQFARIAQTRLFSASPPDLGGAQSQVQDSELFHTDSSSASQSSGRPKISMPQFDYVPPKYTGPSYEEMRAKRSQFTSSANFLFYRNPLLIVDGKMQYLFDQDGKRYLDFFAGISTVGVGHCHPRVTSVVKEQMDRVQHISTIYMNDQHCLYAEELADRLPEGIDCVYFASSGSEANSMATQFARMHTGNFPILTLKNGYHGHGGTQHLTNIGSWNHNIPKTQGVESTCFPDLYRGPFSVDEAAKGYGDLVKESIDFNTSGQVALFMAEAIQGVGGLNPLPCGFIQEAIPHIKAAGGLLLSDEVQTGFGRVGSHYWGCDMLGYKPDIITMAKQMGNGFPLAAVACSKEVASSLNKLTFSTYGANPMAMAAGREILHVIDDEKLQENSKRCGQMMLAGLNDMKSRYEQVGDVRGLGLMIGMEMVKNKETKEPAPELFANMFEKTKDYGLLMGKGGRFGTTFRIQPPMCITEQDVEFSLDVLERSLKESLE